MCTAVQSSGFMGDGQEEQLVSSIKSINEKITDAINNISSDIKSAITETVNLYGDTAGKIKESFAEH